MILCDKKNAILSESNDDVWNCRDGRDEKQIELAEMLRWMCAVISGYVNEFRMNNIRIGGGLGIVYL